MPIDLRLHWPAGEERLAAIEMLKATIEEDCARLYCEMFRQGWHARDAFEAVVRFWTDVANDAACNGAYDAACQLGFVKAEA